MFNMHMGYPPITPIEADIDVLPRKVVRDSIRGISESQLGPSKTLLTEGFYYHSEGGYTVCMVLSVIL